MNQPAVTITNHPERQEYELSLGQDVIGLLRYQIRPHLLAVTHTEVAPEFGGHGFGGKLASWVLDEARQNHLEVLPYCPFVRDYIASHSSYLDLVPVNRRAAFALPLTEPSPV